MRFLAIDLGDKRTGLAVGDDETRLVTPVRVVDAALAPGDALVAAIEDAIREFGPGALVVGLPLNMDGTESGRSALVRRFAARLGERVGLMVYFQDERLSTEAARWEMAGSGLSRKRKKERKDALAAGGILRDFLAKRGRSGGEGGQEGASE